MKKIILFFDGTNNKFDKKLTNVVKAYKVILPDNQFRCYIPGVGTLANKRVHGSFGAWWTKIRELAFGHGLEERVLEAYRILVNHYKPGDEIYMFGFSRGAYTAKVLAGLLHTTGLLSPQNEYLAQYAFNLYKAKRLDWENINSFKKTFIDRRPKIKFLGIWDSVSSVGNLWQMRNYAHTSNIKNVEVVRHAVAIDEYRFMYMNNQSASNGDNMQMWFAGVHSDVGGGNREDESQLSKIPLIWMLKEAERVGLQLDQEKFDTYIMGKGRNNRYVSPDAAGKIHRNHWLWYTLNLIPRVIITNYSKGQAMRKLIFPGFKRREIRPGHQVHTSVQERALAMKYRPSNLP